MFNDFLGLDILANLLRRARVFGAANAGAVTLTFAAGMVIVLLAGGCAIDFGRQYNLQTEIQEVLDKAVLASVASPDEAGKSIEKWVSAYPDVNLKIESLRTRTSDTAVDIRVVATSSIPASIMSLFGVEQLTVRVVTEAQAPLAINEMEISIKEAFGYSNKVVRAMVERPNGKIETLIKSTYRFVNPYGGKGRGTGTIVTVPSGAVKTGEFKRLWFEMDVKAYDTGQVVTYSTEDPKTSNHLWVDGQQLPTGMQVSLNELIPCGGRPKVHEWEDSANPAEWGSQDISFEISGDCSREKNLEEVRLVN